MIFELLTILIMCILIAFEVWKIYLNKTKLKPFHQVRSWPVFGKVLDMIGKNNEEILQVFDPEVTDLSYTWAGPLLVFHVSRPEDMQAVLTSDECIKKAFPYNFLNNETGILTSLPSIWKEHRRALNPTLGPKMVHSFIPIFNEKSRQMVDRMERKLGERVDMHKIMFSAAIDATFKASYGIDSTMQNKRGEYVNDLITYLLDAFQLRIQRIWLWHPIYRMTTEYKECQEKFQQLYRFTRSALETKRMYLAEKLEHGEDEIADVKANFNQNFMQKCLQLEREMKWTEQNVIEEIDTIFVGSVDTSATTINGITLMLAIHPEYQERVVNEMREIFGDVDEPVTKEHLSRMKFLELVIKESIRYFPIVPFLGRESTDDVPVNGGIIPNGSQIILNVLRMNKDKKFYGENAHDFYPERFLPENCADWHPYLYMPFSAGKRNCIGERYAWASLKIAMSYILRRFKLTTDLTMKDVIIEPKLLLKIGNKDAIRIERRNWHTKS